MFICAWKLNDPGRGLNEVVGDHLHQSLGSGPVGGAKTANQQIVDAAFKVVDGDPMVRISPTMEIEQSRSKIDRGGSGSHPSRHRLQQASPPWPSWRFFRNRIGIFVFIFWKIRFISVNIIIYIYIYT